MKKTVLVSCFILLLINLLSSQNSNDQEFKHMVVEDYIQLSGQQILDETNNITIPYSKQGYTLHLPESQPVATIIMLSGAALSKHQLSDKPKFLVGMSLGGTMALRYAEFSLLNKSKHGFRPEAIAICDAPLDMVRMWHEPDISWWIENRGKDYNTINSIDLAGFYNYLRQAGNTQAELITTYNKRRDYKKGSSPHTWTIVDNDELVDWLNNRIPK